MPMVCFHSVRSSISSGHDRAPLWLLVANAVWYFSICFPPLLHITAFGEESHNPARHGEPGCSHFRFNLKDRRARFRGICRRFHHRTSGCPGPACALGASRERANGLWSGRDVIRLHINGSPSQPAKLNGNQFARLTASSLDRVTNSDHDTRWERREWAHTEPWSHKFEVPRIFPSVCHRNYRSTG